MTGGLKKHLSVFMLMARSSIYKVIGLFVLMAAAEWSLFYARLRQGATGDSFNLELVFDESHLMWVFGIGFLLITILLSRTGCEFSSKVGYTLKRLSVSERFVFFWQSLYNILCYLMFWMVQILIVFGLCSLYVKMAPEGYVTNQTVFLAFYRNDFLHSLLPMEDAGFWMKNIMIVIAMGICSARFPMAQRKGSKLSEIIPLTCVTLAFFIGELGEYLSLAITIGVCFICVILAVVHVFEKEGDEFEEMEAN